MSLRNTQVFKKTLSENFCLQLWKRNRDRIYPPASSILKVRQNTWNDSFWALDKSKYRTVIIERRETGKVKAVIVPVYCLESFQDFTQGRETQTESEIYLSSVFERPRHLKMAGKSTAEEGANQRDRSENLWTVPFKSLAEYWSGVWRKYRGWGKGHRKEADGAASEAHRRTENRSRFQ